jgi:hypothetical protein
MNPAVAETRSVKAGGLASVEVHQDDLALRTIF